MNVAAKLQSSEHEHLCSGHHATQQHPPAHRARRHGDTYTGVPRSPVRRGRGRRNRPATLGKVGPRKAASPCGKLRHDLAPVGVHDAEALGESQACEEGQAVAAHAWLSQVDSDPREACRGREVGVRGSRPALAAVLVAFVPWPRVAPGESRGKLDRSRKEGGRKPHGSRKPAGGSQRAEADWKGKWRPATQGGRPRPMQIKSLGGFRPQGRLERGRGPGVPPDWVFRPRSDRGPASMQIQPEHTPFI